MQVERVREGERGSVLLAKCAVLYGSFESSTQLVVE